MSERQTPDQNPDDNLLAAYEAELNDSLEHMYTNVGDVFHRAMRETLMAVHDIPNAHTAERAMRVEPVRSNLEHTAALFHEDAATPLATAGSNEAVLHSLSRDADGSYLLRLDLFSSGEPVELAESAGTGNKYMVVIPGPSEDEPTVELPFIVPIASLTDAIESSDNPNASARETVQSFLSDRHYLTGAEADEIVTALADLPIDTVRAIEETDNLLHYPEHYSVDQQ